MRAARLALLLAIALAVGIARTLRREVYWRRHGPRSEGGFLDRLRNGDGPR